MADATAKELGSLYMTSHRAGSLSSGSCSTQMKSLMQVPGAGSLTEPAEGLLTRVPLGKKSSVAPLGTGHTGSWNHVNHDNQARVEVMGRA